jgi:hypothetical protein
MNSIIVYLKKVNETEKSTHKIDEKYNTSHNFTLIKTFPNK